MVSIRSAKPAWVQLTSILIGAATLTSACEEPLSAHATSGSTTEVFCDAVEETTLEVWAEFSETADDEQVAEANRTARYLKNLVPGDAPPEVEAYLTTAVEATDNGVDGLPTSSDERPAAQAEQETIFSSYVENKCGPNAATSTNTTLAGVQTEDADS